MKELLAQILLSAAEAMWKSQPTLGKYTPETTEREPDLTTHYGQELAKWFPWLDFNFDLIKPGYGDQRPDIVVHRRKSHAANFLVIEVKRESRRNEVSDDLEKIRTQWFKGKLRYRYGASLILDENDHTAVEVRVLFRDQPRAETMRQLRALLHLVLPPAKSALERSPLPKLVDQIVETARQNPNADTSALEREIDRQICALYGIAPEEIKIVESAK